ncbi:MAG: tRNA isopentenyl-2-thiomethyl-A-37 hydroxylase MiaE [Sandaracinaceae bacterium]
MLKLRHDTAPEWVPLVERELIAFLQDHAANERRVSRSALTLAVQHPERAELVDAMVHVSLEELEHFKLVYELLKARGAPLAQDAPDPYMKALRKRLADPDRSKWLLHRLVLFAVVEARGYERFAMLAEGLSDPGLRETYAELARCEARHQGLYLRLARTYYAAEEVETHLDRVLDLEAALLRELPLRPALH